MNQCRNEIESAFASLVAELDRNRASFIAALEELEVYLRAMIEEAIGETKVHPFYPANTHIVALMYERCYQKSFTLPDVFAYQVIVREEHLKDCLAISFST